VREEQRDHVPLIQRAATTATHAAADLDRRDRCGIGAHRADLAAGRRADPGTHQPDDDEHVLRAALPDDDIAAAL
jgi:hypothetical protein